MRNLVIIVCILNLLLVACISNDNKMEIYYKDNLFGEIVIALDIANHTINTSNQLPAPIDEFAEQNNYRPINQKLIEFMEIHPDVTIKVINTKWLTGVQSIFGDGDKYPGYLDETANTIDHAPNLFNMPDIIELTPHQVRFAATDLVQDLSFFIENLPPKVPWESEYSRLVNLANVDGRISLLPVRSDPMIVYYAAPIFESMGLDAPDEQWTWDDYLKIARRLQTQGYVVGDLLRLPSIEPAIYGLGGSFISPDYTEFSGYIDSGATHQAFQLYLEAISPVLEPFYLIERWRYSLPLSTRPAMGITRSSNLYDIFDDLDGIDRGYELATLPLTEHGERVNTTQLTGLAVTNASNDKELAWELMKFIIGDGGEDTMNFIAKNTLILQENRYMTRPLAKHDKLVGMIRDESAHARISALSMFPTTVGGKLDHFYEPSWNIPEDVDLSLYLSELAISLETIRDTMNERGLGAP